MRSSNPIESTFATVRLRTDKTKGCLSRETAPLQGLLALSPPEIGSKACWPLRVFKLAKSAERHWRRLDGASRFRQLIDGIEFRDGEAVRDAEEQAAA